MRQRYLAAVLVLLLVVSGFVIMVGSAVGEEEYPPQDVVSEIELTCAFGAPAVTVEGERCYISMDGAESRGDPTYPVLPQKTLLVAIPAGQELTKVMVEGQTTQMDLDYEVVWEVEPVVIGEEPEGETQKNGRVYESTNPWPGKTHDIGLPATYRGYNIQPVTIYPAHYAAKTGKLDYYTSMDVTLITEGTDAEMPATYRGLDSDRELVAEIVDNPDALATYGGAPEPVQLSSVVDPNQGYDYAVITGQQFVNGWAPFIQYKNDIGIRTVLVTVEDIYAEAAYNGDDDADEVRNFIKDAYMGWGVDYVLLGGDCEVVPERGVYQSSQFPDSPSDMYYSGLDGDWNADGDQYYGEQGEEDFWAEVWIGRVTFDQSNELDNWIDKTLRYEQGLTGSVDQVLMAAQQLNTRPVWGADYMDNLRDLAYPDDEPWVYTDINQRDGTFSRQAIIDALNAGKNMVNHMGHASYASNMGLSRTDPDNLVNEDPYLIYSQGCSSGAFDDDYSGTADAICEHHITSQGGAFAVIMNARYGYYGGWNTGPSQRFHVPFIQALMDDYDTTLGQANQYSKDYNLMQYTTGLNRFLALGLNLLGDPTLTINRPFMYDHEVGITSITAPALVSLGAQVPVDTVLRNSGRYAETVTVELLVDGIVADSQVVTIGRGAKMAVHFTWDAPSQAGLHDVAVQLVFPADENPNNNYAETQVEVADIVTVDDDGPADFSTIAMAVKRTKAGKTIYVYPGHYNENVVVSKRLTIRGSEDATPAVNGGGDAVFTITADDVVLKGFYITGGSYGVVFDGCTGALVESNLITGNTAAGVFFDGASGNTLKANTIENNLMYGSGTGVLMVDSPGNSVEGNEIRDHATYGIRTEDSDSVIIDNLIEDNYYGVWVQAGTAQITQNDIKNNQRGVACTDLTYPLIDGNEICGNYWGVYAEEGAHPEITGNSFCRCCDAGYVQYGVYLYISTPDLLCCNQFESVGIGIYMLESNAVVSGNTFTSCSYGVYVKVGSFPTIAQNTFNDNSQGVYSWQGAPTVEYNDFDDWTGVGLYQSPDAVVRYNTFDGCNMGIRVSSNSDALIQGNTVMNGHYGIEVFYSAPTLLDNVMNDRTYFGLSIDYTAREAIPLMSNNLIDGIDASLLYHYQTGKVLFSGLTYSGALTGHGLLTFYDCAGPGVENCVLSGNRYGVYVQNSYVNVEYNTITGMMSGGVAFRYSTGTIGYNVIENDWFSRAYGIPLLASDPTMVGNDISGGYYGVYVDWDSRPVLTDNTIYDCQYGISIPYGAREIIPWMSGNTVNGIDLGLIYHYDEHGITIRNFDYDSGGIAPGGYIISLVSRLNDQGIITLYDCTDITIRNCDLGGNSYGIYGFNSDATITGCTLFNHLNGVYMFNSPGTVTVQNTQVYGNFGNGLYFHNCDVLISGCDAYDNRGYFFWQEMYPEDEFWVSSQIIPYWGGYGIYLGECTGTVENNDVYDSSNGIYVYGYNSDVAIQNNNVWGNWRGIYVNYAPASVTGNDVHDNGQGLYMRGNTGVASDNDIYDNSYGVYLYSGLHTLSDNDIQNNYVGVIAYYADFLIDGNVISHNKYNGMELRYSGGTISNNEIGHNGNNGITLYESSPVISGNTIEQNKNNGVVCEYNSHATITGNYFYDNYWLSVEVLTYSSPTITYNTMNDYGAVYCFDGSPTIMYNTVSGCYYAFEATKGAHPTIMYNTISNVYTAFYTYGIYGASFCNNVIDGAQYGVFALSSNFDCHANDISNSQTGIYVGWSTTLYMEENSISGCQVGIEADGGYGSSCTGTIWQNTISGNQVGIWLKGGTSFVVGYNEISYNQYGVRVEGRRWLSHGGWRYNPAYADINDNNIFGNGRYGVYNEHLDMYQANRDHDGDMVVVDATQNWWGDSSGPYHPVTNPDGLGDEVSDYVDYTPYKHNPVNL